MSQTSIQQVYYLSSGFHLEDGQLPLQLAILIHQAHILDNKFLFFLFLEIFFSK